MSSASGTFDVKVIPQTPAGNPRLGRFALDKVYQGDLEAVSQGEMLTGGDPKSGSAGYVAMELVTGTLQGRKGTFMLQHTGSMKQGVGTMTVTVVPGSATEELAGLSGEVKILIEGGKHSYEFEYTFA